MIKKCLKIFFSSVYSLAYCEGRSNGICNSIIQCPFGEICRHGFCRNTDYTLEKFLSFDLLSISISISSIILLGIILILSISLCILRRQRWKKRSPPVQVKKQVDNHLPTTSDYDNVVYGVFRHHVQSPSNENPTSFHNNDPNSYHPKIVFLGGDEQLTAIYA